MEKRDHFSEKDLDEFYKKVGLIPDEYQALLSKYHDKVFLNDRSKEFFIQGFFRRLGILKSIITNVYKIFPPKNYLRLSHDDVQNITINLQAFVFNVYGCLDNLARIWVLEKNIAIEDRKISFGNKIIRATFSNEFVDYLFSLNDWYKNYLVNFRDALSHRIPLYVPPYMLTESEVEMEKKLEKELYKNVLAYKFDEYEKILDEKDSLGRSSPYMTHSETDNSGYIVFHAQLLSDWNTLLQLFDNFMKELNKIET